MTATGVTVAHLSAGDRGAVAASRRETRWLHVAVFRIRRAVLEGRSRACMAKDESTSSS